jgi:hypothetical protein
MTRIGFASFPSVPFASQPRRRALPHFMVALALCALLALAGSAAFAQWPAPGAASSANAVQPAAVTPPKPAHAEPGAGGVHDGIVVHGLWSIDVRNPDGTVAAHRDFENSLFSTGGTTLEGFLIGVGVPGGWDLSVCDLETVNGVQVSGPCGGLDTPGILLVEPGGAQANPTTGGLNANGCTAVNGCYAVLSAPTEDAAGGVTLTGTVTLPQSSAAYTFNQVQSALYLCLTVIPATATTPEAAQNPNSTLTPSACFDLPPGQTTVAAGTNVAIPQVLTIAAIQPSVTVNPGQSITVTFNLSFTSAS